MSGHRHPGPYSQIERPVLVIDGTLCQAATPRPGPVGLGGQSVAGWSTEEKLLGAMRRTIPKLPSEMREQFAALLSPENIAITAGVLVVWAGSHFFGVGEAVDVVLLGVGVVLLGRQAWQVGRDIGAFLARAVRAQTEEDLDQAAEHLARAVALIGVTAFVALITRAAGKPLARAGARIRGAVRGRLAPRLRGDGAGTPQSPGGLSAGEEGAWWEASDFGEDWPGTAVPRGFNIRVGGRTFRVHPNATKHMAENAGRMPSAGELRNPGTWSPSPGAPMAEIDYPLSSLAGALEQAAARLQGLPRQRHFFQQGNWQLGVDTGAEPWVVYHAVPMGQ
jgi:hypothetical protein